MKRGGIHYFVLFVSSVVLAQETIVEIGELPDAIRESSGLIYYNGRLITHNDSGNTPQLFEVDTLNLAITRTVNVANATNVDWEDIAQDDKYIYIGDFGNFRGDRQDLVIYRVAKSDYDVMDAVVADRIDFSYVEQTDFSGDDTGSDWDAEAMFVIGDQLIILTKQWRSLGTVAYGVPKEIGTYEAIDLGTYHVNGLVTGATYNALTNTLFLVGYSQTLFSFVTQFTNATLPSVFEGMVKRTNLNIGMAQVESITHTAADTYFFSSERFLNDNPPIHTEARLFTFKLVDDIPKEEEEEVVDTDQQSDQLVLYRNFGSQSLGYDLQTQERLFGRAIFDTTGSMIRFTHAKDINRNEVDVSTMPAAVYYLTFFLQNGVLSKAFILD
ncbi:MAG: T9SS C-terminal target domain-containing protein [Bacteroidota bacterium]